MFLTLTLTVTLTPNPKPNPDPNSDWTETNVEKNFAPRTRLWPGSRIYPIERPVWSGGDVVEITEIEGKMTNTHCLTLLHVIGI